MNMSKAVTLVEVIVVTAILIVLSTVVWLVIGPSMKAKSVETQIRSDLKQIVAAIHIYMADYDGQLPRSQDVLPKGTPTSIVGLPKQGSVGYKFGGNLYFYTQPYSMQVFSSKFAKYPWDQHKDPIVKALMRIRDTGRKSMQLHIDHTGQEQLKEGDETFVLGARLDGSIAWFPATQIFEHEFAALSWKLGRLR